MPKGNANHILGKDKFLPSSSGYNNLHFLVSSIPPMVIGGGYPTITGWEYWGVLDTGRERYGASVVDYNSRIWMLGGRNTSNNYTALAESMDIATQITTTHTASSGKTFAGHCYVEKAGGHYMYQFGGIPAGGGVASTEVRSWDLDNPNVAMVAHAAVPIAGVQRSVDVWDGTQYIYHFGGYSSSYNNKFYRYDVINNTWNTTLTTVPIATADCAGMYYDGKVYIAGGQTTGGVNLTDLQIYDVATNTWAVGASMPYAKRFGAYIQANGDLIFTMGYDAAVLSNTTLHYYRASNQWAVEGITQQALWGVYGAYDSGSNRIYTRGGKTATLWSSTGQRNTI